LRLDPSNPGWPARDRFLLSKGHASAAMYVAMAWRGFFPRERLFDSFNRPHSILQEHVNMDTPGAEIPTGSLGMGLSAGAGMVRDTAHRERQDRSIVNTPIAHRERSVATRGSLLSARASPPFAVRVLLA
jgi:transketolase